MTVEEYFKEWLNVIDKKELYSVTSKLATEYKQKLICPNQKDVFKAFELCSLRNLKVVMLGQDL
jgi:uracil DNA glycosylase